MDTLGKRIKLIRKRLGLNQTEFAEKLGLETAVAISKYETDQTAPDIAKLITISELGQVTLDWLLTGKDFIETGTPEKPAYKAVEDIELAEIINILKVDDPEAKKHVLSILRSRITIKESIKGLLKMSELKTANE